MQTKQINKIISLALIAFVVIASIIISSNAVSAKAETVTLVSNGVLYGDNLYGGQNSEDASYVVYCDSSEVTVAVSHSSAPAYKNANSLPNACGPLTGANLIGFYDRYLVDLIPDFTPGFDIGSDYVFSPLTPAAVTSVITELNTLMKTGELGGTSSANFKSGLNTYIKNHGYNFSYYSFYASEKSVNFDILKSAINQGQVGVLMCSGYNFISGIIPYEGFVNISKYNSSMNHMLLVYGYETRVYYNNGVAFRTDTFLKVCEGGNTGEKGYLQLNDYLTIDEAVIISIN